MFCKQLHTKIFAKVKQKKCNLTGKLKKRLRNKIRLTNHDKTKKGFSETLTRMKILKLESNSSKQHHKNIKRTLNKQ